MSKMLARYEGSTAEQKAAAEERFAYCGVPSSPVRRDMLLVMYRLERGAKLLEEQGKMWLEAAGVGLGDREEARRIGMNLRDFKLVAAVLRWILRRRSDKDLPPDVLITLRELEEYEGLDDDATGEE